MAPSSRPDRGTYRCSRAGCDNRFQPSAQSPHQMYCSTTCRVGAFQGRPKVELKARRCEQCGDKFSPDRSTARYCSDTCRWAAASATPRKRKRPAAGGKRAAAARTRSAAASRRTTPSRARKRAAASRRTSRSTARSRR
jgi:hypothetical protein